MPVQARSVTLNKHGTQVGTQGHITSLVGGTARGTQGIPPPDSVCGSVGPSPTPKWPEVRSRILERDSAICQLCGTSGADTVDHITPQVFGGQHDEQNLRSAHRDCNAREFWQIQRWLRPAWVPRRMVAKRWEYPRHFTDEQFAIIRHIQRAGR